MCGRVRLIAPKAFHGDFATLGPDIVIRPITDDDMPFLRNLYASTREDELTLVEWTAEAKQTFLAEQFALQHDHYRHYSGAEFLLIERKGERIGRIYVHRSKGEIRLMDIALIDSERGRGLGTRLLAELMAEARTSHAQITVHVEPNNPANRLYERLGFKVIENRGVYLFLGWSA